MIPKTIHQLWLSGDPIHEKYHELRLSWITQCPDFTCMLWTLDDVLKLPLLESARKQLISDIHYVMKSDIARWEILRIVGGVYADTDVRCLKNIEPLLGGYSFAGRAYPPTCMGNAVVGAEPNQKIIQRISAGVTGIVDSGLSSGLLSQKEIEDDVVNFAGRMLEEIYVIYPTVYFYPYSWFHAREDRGKAYPDSYTEHLWLGIEPDGWNRSISKNA